MPNAFSVSFHVNAMLTYRHLRITSIIFSLPNYSFLLNKTHNWVECAIVNLTCQYVYMCKCNKQNAMSNTGWRWKHQTQHICAFEAGTYSTNLHSLYHIQDRSNCVSNNMATALNSKSCRSWLVHDFLMVLTSVGFKTLPTCRSFLSQYEAHFSFRNQLHHK